MLLKAPSEDELQEELIDFIWELFLKFKENQIHP